MTQLLLLNSIICAHRFIIKFGSMKLNAKNYINAHFVYLKKI